jgi:Fe-S-cluster containining protein
MRTSCLSFHAAYACAHSGACCTAPWPIPVDDGDVLRLRARGLIPGDRVEHVRPLDRPVNGMTLALATTADHACVFFEAGGGRLCRIHRDGGADLLPSACRAFPRVALRDSRGLFITLSHYCPTAARLLLDAGDILIIDAPDALSLGGEVEGLDATEVLPPLLRPDMLMDREGYARWEHDAIAVLNDRLLPARDAASVIRAATRETCEWRPGDDTLAEWTSRAFAHARDAILQRGASEGVKRSSTPNLQLPTPKESCSTVFAGNPVGREGCRPVASCFEEGGSSAPRPERRAAVSRLEHATKAFLAAHLFASWAAYQQGGLWAVVDAVGAAHALVGNPMDEASFLDAVRSADLRLRHG